jgi:hypothetical protein
VTNIERRFTKDLAKSISNAALSAIGNPIRRMLIGYEQAKDYRDQHRLEDRITIRFYLVLY